MTWEQQLFDALLIGLILSNVMAVVLGTVEPIQERYGELLSTFELLSVTVFTLEWMLRCKSSELFGQLAA